MKLLTEKELAWSPIVANTNMNRKRKATGINSYEKDIKLNPIQFLQQCITARGSSTWLDLCCGEGNALIQTAVMLQQAGLQQKARLTGIDLVDHFAPIPAGIDNVSLLVQSLDEWLPNDKHDLITCVHGLHYAGDKLNVLQKAFNSLTPNGVLTANLDLNSIHIKNADAKKYLQGIFTQNGIYFSQRSRIITCTGQKNIDFGITFIGANDEAGPNYTGQPAVDSYYVLNDQRLS